MIPNLIGPAWSRPDADTLPVFNPATGEVIEQVPLSSSEEVRKATDHAVKAYESWSRTSLTERVQL